jgi:hypothetical protein
VEGSFPGTVACNGACIVAGRKTHATDFGGSVIFEQKEGPPEAAFGKQ